MTFLETPWSIENCYIFGFLGPRQPLTYNLFKEGVLKDRGKWSQPTQQSWLTRDKSCLFRVITCPSDTQIGRRVEWLPLCKLGDQYSDGDGVSESRPNQDKVGWGRSQQLSQMWLPVRLIHDGAYPRQVSERMKCREQRSINLNPVQKTTWINENKWL